MVLITQCCCPGEKSLYLRTNLQVLVLEQTHGLLDYYNIDFSDESGTGSVHLSRSRVRKTSLLRQTTMYLNTEF